MRLWMLAIALVALVACGGSGPSEAQIAAEQEFKDAVQASVDLMMSDNNMSAVTANGTAAKIVSATTDFGGGQLISRYFRVLATRYCYTWDATGALLTQTDCFPQSAEDAEYDALQNAIDIMMSDKRLNAVTANDTPARITGATDFGGGQATAIHERYRSTYCYTWDATGRLLTQTDCFPATREQAIKDSEWDYVQSALDLMIVDNDLIAITANGTAAKITATTDFGGGQLIAIYMRDLMGDLPTTFCYTWDAGGLILTQADC